MAWSPVVAVTTDRRSQGPKPRAAGRVRPPRPEVFLGHALVDAVRAAGGLPLLLPPGPGDAETIAAVLARVDAVIVSGGAFDIDPRHYGQAVQARVDRIDEDRTGLELALCRACLDQGVPILGICGGMQALAVAAGGSLLQDIATQRPGSLPHEQSNDPAQTSHPVLLQPGRLRRAAGAERISVNSTHHQAVDDPGALRVTGRSPDGIVEAVEADGDAFALGVQWHPELLDQAWLFQALLAPTP